MESGRASARRDLALLAGITIVAAIARFATLDLQSFHHDEAVTAGRVIVPNLFHTLGFVESSERSPPLYYLIAWGWAKLFGTGEVGLRSLSAVVGTLTVPAAYLAGRELLARAPSASRIGLLAAGFVALNPYLVWYSQEARAYALMALCATLALAFFARARREPTPTALGLWAGASALSLLSHYFAIFLVAAQGVWLIWSLGAVRVRAVLAVAAVAAVGVALLPLAHAQEGEGRRNGFTEIALPTRAGEVAVDYVASEEPDPLAGSSRVDAIQLGTAVGGGLALLGALWLIARRASEVEQRAAALAGGVAASAILIPLLLAVAGLDFINPRNLIAGLVPILALAAIGFGAERSGRLGAIAALATCVIFAGVVLAVSFSAEMQRPDWRSAAEAMGEAHGPRLIVTNRNGDDPLAYYLGAEKFEGGRFTKGVEVSQIEALSTNFHVRPPPGFRLADEQGLAPLFILWRFESGAPRRVRPADLAGGRVLSERSAALLDAP